MRSIIVVLAVLSSLQPAEGVCASTFQDLLPWEKAEVRIENGVVSYEGAIMERPFYEVQRLFDEAPALDTLVINSYGGHANAGVEFGDYVRKRGILVRVKEKCLSACASHIAVAAKELEVPAGALLGFHGADVAFEGFSEATVAKLRESLIKKGLSEEEIESTIASSNDSNRKATEDLMQATIDLYNRSGISFSLIYGTSPNVTGLKPDQFVVFTERALRECFGFRNLTVYPNYSDSELGDHGQYVILDDCPPDSHCGR